MHIHITMGTALEVSTQKVKHIWLHLSAPFIEIVKVVLGAHGMDWAH